MHEGWLLAAAFPSPTITSPTSATSQSWRVSYSSIVNHGGGFLIRVCAYDLVNSHCVLMPAGWLAASLGASGELPLTNWDIYVTRGQPGRTRALVYPACTRVTCGSGERHQRERDAATAPARPPPAADHRRPAPVTSLSGFPPTSDLRRADARSTVGPIVRPLATTRQPTGPSYPAD
jgi:hypothetical protein